MNDAEIANLLKARLGENTALPVAWPNDTAPSAKPYLAVSIKRVSTLDPTLDGTGKMQRGRLLIAVVIDEGIAEDTANTKADQIAALFPYGLRLNGLTGQITIVKPPHVSDGYPMGPSWRVPVIIDFSASDSLAASGPSVAVPISIIESLISANVGNAITIGSDGKLYAAASAAEVFVQQTRPAGNGPWVWYQTDGAGVIIDTIIADGGP